MFSRVGHWASGLDQSVRGYMGNQAAEALSRGSDRYVKEMMGRASAQNPDFDSIGRALEDRIGGDYLKHSADLQTGDDAARQQMFENAYLSGGSKPVAGFLNMMSGTGALNRAGQVGVYSAGVGGVTLGLTAAGQGLFALMDYMQQGQQADQERNQPLA